MRIAVASRSFSRNDMLRCELEKLCADVVYNDTNKTLVGDELVQFLKSADAAVIGLERIDEYILGQCPKLKAIGKYGVGLDNIDLKALARRGIYFEPKMGVNARSVAELVVMMAIFCFREIDENRFTISKNDWVQKPGKELHMKVIGIIGLGHVGKIVAQLMYAFGMTVYYYDTDESIESTIAEKVSLEFLLKSSDIVTLHIPKTKNNENFFDAEKIAMLKQKAVLINTSRGGLVDEEALFVSLKAGALHSAYFDVLEEEPPNKKKRFPDNFYLTKHIGGSTKECILRMGRAAIINLKNYIEQTHEKT